MKWPHFAWLGLLLALLPCSVGFCAIVEGTVNRITELTFASNKHYSDPFNQIQLDLLVTSPDGKQLRIPAFWAGGQTWRARYSSPLPGIHHWITECSDPANGDLHAQRGSIALKPYTGVDPLYLHGFVQIAPDHRHLQYADGTPFFWLADTWWMGLCSRLGWPDDFQKLTLDRKQKGFTVVQIVAGLYPDMFPFDPRGANEAGYPWEKDYTRINPSYFDAADQRLQYLADQGFTPCIFGAWGYFLPWMGEKKMQQHWRYLIARYGAMPVVWCAAGEANLPWYLAKGFPYDDRQQVAGWTRILRYIRQTDPYHRPLTIHPTGIGRLSARHATDDADLLDFDMLQTPHGQREAVDVTVKTVRESYADHPIMPVIDGEASYEMLGDSLPTRWTRQMFWLCMTNGAAGHTYGANGIWQVNRPGQPHGPSPHHAPGSHGYGIIPWQQAMNLPGSTQVSLGKKLFEQYDWQTFEPHPQWATYAPTDPAHQPDWGRWIWFDEGNPSTTAPAAKRFFRKSFNLPDPFLRTATLWLSADDHFTAYINGQRLGSGDDWRSPQSINVSRFLRPGQNILAIEAENRPAPVKDNPAGLISCLRIEPTRGQPLTIASDATWRASKDLAPTAQWTTTTFDDHTWPTAKDLGPYGCAPWGKFSTATSYGPFTIGSSKTRFTYVPELRPILIRDLQPDTSYRARTFNPVTGQITDLGLVTPDNNHTWAASPPAWSEPQDWLLIIETEPFLRPP